MKEIVLIVHNIRSSHNVGSVLRSADGLGVKKVYLTGYTPYPAAPNDQRLPHLVQKIEHQINKTALGAQNNVEWEHQETVSSVISDLNALGYQIVALEQTAAAKPLDQFKPKNNIALVVGSETTGLDPEVIHLTDTQVEIPMLGQKESFNVAVAAGIALYHLRYKT